MAFVLDDMVRVIGAEGAAPAEAPEEQQALYGQLVGARRLDARVQALEAQGLLAGYASTAGREALLVGATAAMGKSDWLFPAGADGAAVLARGVPLEVWLAHLLGRAGDPSRARQPVDRFSGRAWRVATVNPHGSSQLAQAVGLAWAARRTGDAAVCFADERAVEHGAWHDGLNFAGVMRAPVVFVVARRAAPVARAAFGYGVAAVRVDGVDALAVRRVVADALARARRGDGATLVEATLAEGECPLERMRQHLVGAGLLDDAAATDAAIARAVDEGFDAALTAARGAATPGPETMFEDVFASAPWHLAEQRAQAAGRRAE